MFSPTCAAISLLCILAVAYAQITTPVQVGDMKCIFDTSTKVMKASMYIFKKTSPVTRAYFTRSDYYGHVYDAPACEWTGTGSDTDPFMAEVEVDSQTNLPPVGKSGCGYSIVDADQQIYRWIVYNQRENHLGREGDAVFIFECSGRGTPNSASVTISLDTEDKVGQAVRVRPENQIAVLEKRTGSSIFSQLATDGVSVGQEVILRVQSKVKALSNRQVGVDHYGVYVFHCEHRTSINGDPTRFLELNGCGNNEFRGLTGTGFEYKRFSTINAANERWFQTETSPFVLVPDIPYNDYYYIRCFVGYCYGTELADNRCDDYCGENARSRRSLVNTTEVESVSIKIKVNKDSIVTNNDITSGVTNAPPAEENIEGEIKENGLDDDLVIIIAVVSVVAVFFVLLCVVCVVCCIKRNRPRSGKEWTDTSTVDSRRSFPHYMSGQYQEYPKY